MHSSTENGGCAAMLASEEADAAALEAVENLLESYFVQIDSTFDKLEAIGALVGLLCPSLYLALTKRSAPCVTLLGCHDRRTTRPCRPMAMDILYVQLQNSCLDLMPSQAVSRSRRCIGGLLRVTAMSRSLRAGEYIEDTEEYINIELDSSRNRLIRLEIVLTGATFSLALWNLVAGAPLPGFRATSSGCVGPRLDQLSCWIGSRRSALPAGGIASFERRHDAVALATCVGHNWDLCSAVCRAASIVSRWCCVWLPLWHSIGTVNS